MVGFSRNRFGRVSRNCGKATHISESLAQMTLNIGGPRYRLFIEEPLLSERTRRRLSVHQVMLRCSLPGKQNGILLI